MISHIFNYAYTRQPVKTAWNCGQIKAKQLIDIKCVHIAQFTKKAGICNRK